MAREVASSAPDAGEDFGPDCWLITSSDGRVAYDVNATEASASYRAAGWHGPGSDARVMHYTDARRVAAASRDLAALAAERDTALRDLAVTREQIARMKERATSAERKVSALEERGDPVVKRAAWEELGKQLVAATERATVAEAREAELLTARERVTAEREEARRVMRAALTRVHGVALELAHALRLAVLTEYKSERRAALDQWAAYVLEGAALAPPPAQPEAGAPPAKVAEETDAYRERVWRERFESLTRERDGMRLSLERILLEYEDEAPRNLAFVCERMARLARTALTPPPAPESATPTSTPSSASEKETAR